MDSLIESFKMKFNTKTKPIQLDQLQSPEFFEDPVFIDCLATLQDSEWIYGPNPLDSPSFWFKNTHGVFEIQLSLDDGIDWQTFSSPHFGELGSAMGFCCYYCLRV
eukprot:Protomagalhaensia_wolfi_Nauph_80__3270@NODE_3329_length_825_cov_2_989822_g2611_i0_p1_GENE_NODE_3329_length_825_cov_2_989822_g2611_i0NODE_3329_length_825_cov_2_989822_g2611_i0_p1_ORF_typecomplete_len106_score6_49_NODE_3329_length_825_cov_2_989822_g2611_i0448765